MVNPPGCMYIQLCPTRSIVPSTPLYVEVLACRPTCQRPASEQQQNEQILKEALPSIGASVILAVLRVSRGQVDLAFNALLEMTDPDVVRAGGRRTFRPGSCHPELEAA